MEEFQILEQYDYINNKINDILSIIRKKRGVNYRPSYQELILIYCNVMKDESLDTKNITHFKMILESNYNLAFNNEEAMKKFVCDIYDTEQIRQSTSDGQRKDDIKSTSNYSMNNTEMNDIYNWDTICLLINEINQDITNLNFRVKLIDKLCFTLKDTFNDYTKSQILNLIKILEEQLLFLSNMEYKQLDKNEMFLKYTSNILLGEINVIQGKIDKAIKHMNVVYQWDEVTKCIEKDNDLEDIYLYNTYNIIRLLYFLELENKANKFKNKHSHIFDKMINLRERMLNKPNQSLDMKIHLTQLIHEWKNLDYEGDLHCFEYSWLDDYDVKDIYRDVYIDGVHKYGTHFCDYSMGGAALRLSISKDLLTGKYSDIFCINEEDKKIQRKAIEIMF